VTWLLIFVPVTIGLEELAPERYLLIFITSSLAILPLARWMGDATEQLATHFGEGVGGLLNATFGNAAELIIALGNPPPTSLASVKSLSAFLSSR
jgi:Ca2+:H+ antiporter